MAKRKPTEYLRTMGVKVDAPLPGSLPRVCRHCGGRYVSLDMHEKVCADRPTGQQGMMQSVHEFASCPCEACAWLRKGKSAEQLEQMQRAALQAAPIVKPNKEQL